MSLPLSSLKVTPVVLIILKVKGGLCEERGGALSFFLIFYNYFKAAPVAIVCVIRATPPLSPL
jgi:hypothetical protein